MSTPTDSLYQWLESAGLQKFYSRMKVRGVTATNFIDLQLEDYNELGVIDQNDRVKLFRLKQIIKTEADMNKQIIASKKLGNHLGEIANAYNNKQSIQSQPQSQPQSSARNNNAVIDDLFNDDDDLMQPAIAPSSLGVKARAEREKYNSNNHNNISSSNNNIPPPRNIPLNQPSSSASSPNINNNLLNIQINGNSQQQSKSNINKNISVQPVPPVQLPPTPNEDDDLDIEEYTDDIEIDESFSDKIDERRNDASNGTKKSKISVVVRKRPLNTKERSNGEKDIVGVKAEDAGIIVAEPKIKVDLTKFTNNQEFLFDGIFDIEATNYEIYRRTAQPLIDSIFKKGKATCFAYGQTGSGKTFTMLGGGSSAPFEHQGLYVLAARDIFATMAKPEHKNLMVCVSFFEIYGGKFFDLLNGRNKLVIREDANQKCNVVGLTDNEVTDIKSLMNLIEQGNATRSTGVTGANLDSSRSHAILQIMLNNRETGRLHGKFSFIDLAGSERAADTSNNDRQTRLEGADINQSLLALKECIRALDQNAKHLPFRQSKLTQDSFVGNSRTVMIATVSPNSGACEHTLNTLRYAYRVKELKKENAKSAVENVNAYMPHHDKNFHGPSLHPVASSPTPSQIYHEKEKEKNSQQPMASSRIPVSKPQTSRDRNISPNPHIEDNEELQKTHSFVVNQIFADEEQMVDAHRRQIDETMKLVKEEMDLLRCFDKQEIVLEDYVQSLDSILSRKIKAQAELRDLLAEIKVHLQQEDSLSSSMKKRNLY